MNGKYNREAISIGETTWLVGTKVKWCGYQGKAVRGKLRTAAAVVADWHGRLQRESHADRMGGETSEFPSRPEVVKPAKACIQSNSA